MIKVFLEKHKIPIIGICRKAVLAVAAFLVLSAAVGKSAVAQNGISQAYAILKDSTLTLYYNSSKPQDRNEYENIGYSGADIKKVVFDESFENYKPTSCEKWFSGCSNLTEIVDMDKYLNTEKVESTAYMFAGCSKLSQLDLSAFKKYNNVKYMGYMFSGCSNLKTLDLSDFYTSYVTSMEYMFHGCSGLQSIDLSMFDTESVKYMYGMFAGCSNLVSIDFGSVKNAFFHVTSMAYLFSGCSSLQSIDLSSFNSTQLGSDGMSSMFYNCSSLETIDLSSFDTHDATSMSKMFAGCSKLKSIDLNSFNSQKVIYMDSLFAGCTSLTSLDLSGFNTAAATNMSDMFTGCTNLVALDLSGFDTQKVRDMSRMFLNDGVLKTVRVGKGWDITNVGNGGSMFKDCISLVGGKGSAYNADWNQGVIMAHIDCGAEYPGYLTAKDASIPVEIMPYAIGLNPLYLYCDGNGYKNKSADNIMHYLANGTGYTSEHANSITTKVVIDDSFKNYKPKSCASWFAGWEKLTSIEGLKNINTENVTEMYDMFSGCSSLQSLDLSGLKTDNVTNMNYMFSRCSSLQKLDLSGFNTSNVTNMSGMFYNDSSLVSIDISGFNTSKVTNMRSMFYKCSSLVSLDLSSFDTHNVTYMATMFYGCKKLTSLDLSGFDTKNVKSMGTRGSYRGFNGAMGMFENCSSLIKLDISSFNTSNVTAMGAMFAGCSSLVELDIRSFDTKNVEFMSFLFDGCINLELVLVGPKWSTSSIKADFKKDMYKDCDKLTGCYESGKLTYIGNGYVGLSGRTLSFMTYCSDNSTFDETYGLNTDKNLPGWSDNALQIEKVVFDPLFRFVKPTSCYAWFFNCRNLTEIEGLQYLNTEDVANMGRMFAGCREITELDLSSFDTEKVDNMKEMFGCSDTEEDKTYYCQKLETIYVGEKWNVKYTEADKLFEGCKSLTGGKGTLYDANHLGIEYAVIDGGVSAPGYLTFKPLQRVLKSILVSVLPKTEYLRGEKLSVDGGKLTIIYTDNTISQIDLSSATITGFEPNTIGEQTIKVVYRDSETTYKVNVSDRTPVSIAIEVTPKSEYIEGEELSSANGVMLVTYDDNTTEQVDLSQATLSGYDKTMIGEQTIIVSYSGLETSFIVTVKAKGNDNPVNPDNPDNPDNPSTPVSSVSNNGVTVWSFNHTIFISNAPTDTEYKIIDTNGRVLTTSTTKSTHEEIKINKSGVLIVIIDNQSFKVIN